MTSEDQIRNLVEAVIGKIMSEKNSAPASAPAAAAPCAAAVEEQKAVGLLVPNPQNKEAYEALLKATSARIGVWRAGTRPLTKTMLKFRADHAVAQDAVLSAVNEDIIGGLGLLPLESRAESKDIYLTRPDLGRLLSDESAALLKKEAPAKAQVQIVVGDGLSASAIDANLKDIFSVCKEGLKSKGYHLGRDVFVKNSRVGIVNCIGELLQPELVLLFIGERPGLGTAESMSAYLTYRPQKDTVEAQRTMISNIHKGGVPPVEAGAQIVSLVQKILEKKVSGLDLDI